MAQRRRFRLAACFALLASSLGLGAATLAATPAHAVLCSAAGGTSAGAAGAGVEVGPGNSVAVCDPTTGDARLGATASGSGAAVSEGSCTPGYTLCTSGNLAQVANGSNASGEVAVANGGNAQAGECNAFVFPWCLGLTGVAVSNGGSADGGFAVTTTGTATGNEAVSLTGTTTADHSVSGTGNAYATYNTPDEVAVSGTGDSEANLLSVSGTYGVGLPVEVPGLRLVSAPPIPTSVPPPNTGCPPVGVDLTQTPPVYRNTCPLGNPPPQATCDGCTAYNGMKWRTSGKTEYVAAYDRENTSNEMLDENDAHGTLIRSAHGTNCIDAYSGDEVWQGFSGTVYNAYGTSPLGSPDYTGKRSTWVSAGGSHFENNGGTWDLGENGEIDICEQF